MRRRLARHVHVGDTVWGPHDDVPDDVAARITNPGAWVRGGVEDEPPPELPQEQPAAQPEPETRPEVSSAYRTRHRTRDG